MSANPTTVAAEILAPPTLELIWQEDASAYAFTRTPEGELSAANLSLGRPAVAEVALLGRELAVRRVEVAELIRLAAAPTTGFRLGESARAAFAIVELAHRSLGEGLVHPSLVHEDGSWSAFWGATLDGHVQATLSAIAAAMPPACAGAFDGDAQATVLDLYPVVVDQLARDRLREARVRLTTPTPYGRRSALDLFLDGLTAPEAGLPPHSGYAALERQLTRWVGGGLDQRSAAPWKPELRLDESTSGALVLELWLQAEDDTTLSLPAARLWDGGAEIFAFVRASDAPRDLIRQLDALEPVLAEAGIEFDAAEPAVAELGADEVRSFLRNVLPRLEERGVPVLLPAAWMRAPRRLRVNLHATSPEPGMRSGGLLSPAALATFDWRLAIGDVTLTEEELDELASADESFVQVGGRWQAVRRSEIERALRFLEQRRTGAGIVELVRAVSGLETDEAGLELGEVTLDAPLAELLEGDERRFRPRATPALMRFPLFPFQERGHGWLRLLGDLGMGAILADDMGLGKTVQAIAMLVSEREEAGPDALGPTLVVCPMSVVRQWEAELGRFAPSLRVHVHHGLGRLTGDALADAPLASDVVVTSYDVATRDADALAGVAWDRLLLD